MPASAIAERFVKTCRDNAGAAAVLSLSDQRSLTFGDLLEQFAAARRALMYARIVPGSCVVSLVGNRAVFFPLFAACMDAGAALLPLHEATDAEAAALVEKAGAVAVVSDRPLPIEASDGVRFHDSIRVARLTGRRERPSYGRSVVLKLTSGLTNLPKAAVATELQLINDGRHVVEAMGITPADVNLACIPLSHSYALGNIVLPLISQATSVALRQSYNPALVLADAAASRATVFPGVPFMFEHMQTSADVGRLPASLRLLITAGARIDLGTVRWFDERLHRKIHSFYGSSETGGIAYDDSDEVPECLHVGRPMPETTIEIKPDERSSEGAGRIFVSGTAVCAGYAEARSGRTSAFQRGGFLTGDIGRFDDEGRLVLSGRVSPMVNVAGRKVDPADVERVLAGLPGIIEARVLGMSCNRRGQQLVAFVVRSRPSLTTIAIRQLCAGLLSPYKIPRQFVFLDRLPVDARGKMDRPALEALASTL